MPHADDTPTARNDEEARRQQRLETLHRLAEEQPGMGASPPPPPPLASVLPTANPTAAAPQSRRKVAIVGLVIVVCAALIAGVALRSRTPAQVTITPPLPAQLALDTQNLGCPIDAAWSPDSHALAVVGDLFGGQSCLSGGQLNLYDMTTGKLKKQLALDSAVLPPARAADSDIAASASVNYTHVLWSPDGRHIAVTFDIFGAAQPSTAVSGLWVADANGEHPHVLVRAFGTNYLAPTEWTVGGGPLPFEPPGPALSYTWGANSALLTNTPLNPTHAPAVPPLGPIGSPSGPTFSIWQPGLAQLVLSPLGRYEPHFPGAYTYSTNIATWSPDGTLLWDNLGNLDLVMRIPLEGHPAPSAQTLRAFGMTATPLLSVRDAGLQAIYDAMKTTALDYADAGAQTVQVAWRPDGRYVASQLALIAFPPPTDLRLRMVTIHDCATGAVAATLTPPQPKQTPGVGNANILRWSPDGAHLLLLDRDLQEALVWSGSSLPK